jgi:hypothetical protein
MTTYNVAATVGLYIASLSLRPRHVRLSSDSGKIAASQRTDVEGHERKSQGRFSNGARWLNALLTFVDGMCATMAQGFLRRRIRMPIKTARIADATKLAGTQNAARAIPSSAIAADNPLALATSPAIAAPSAAPICCTVETDEAAIVSSPAFAPSIMRCATKGQHWPMPAPSKAIAGINNNVEERVARIAIIVRLTPITAGPVNSSRSGQRDSPDFRHAIGPMPMRERSWSRRTS